MTMNMRRNTNTDIGKIEVEETGLIDVVKCLMNLRKVVVPFILFVNRCCMGACTGISFVDGIQLITKLKSNMKGQLMTVSDKILLRKRALIETINGELKNIAQIEHSRHRSVVGFTVNLMAGLAAYSFFPKKPMIDVERIPPYENGVIQLSLF